MEDSTQTPNPAPEPTVPNDARGAGLTIRIPTIHLPTLTGPWTGIKTLVLLVVAFAVYFFSLEYSSAFSSLVQGLDSGNDVTSAFTTKLVNLVINGSAFVAMHHHMQPGTSTKQAFEEKNTAYGLFLVAIAIVILAANHI